MSDKKTEAIINVLLSSEGDLSDGFEHYTPWRYGDKQPEAKIALLRDIAKNILAAINEVQDE